MFSPKVFLDLLPAPLEDLWNRLVSHKVSLMDDQPWMEAEAFRLLEECYRFAKVTDPVEQWRLVNDAMYKSYVAKMAAMLKQEDSKMLDREVLAGYLPPAAAAPALVEKGPNSSGGEMTTYLPQLRLADSARVSGVSKYFWPSVEKQAELGQQVFGGRTYQKPDVEASDAAQEKRAKNGLELWPWYWHAEMRPKFAAKIMGKILYERLSGSAAPGRSRSPSTPRPKRTKTSAKRAPNKRKAPSRSDLAP
ncbi:hypothetical protein WJX72_001108 [[Myrmecia] bisecta]|uniref:Uncharacterized protein n=1 Tax=[Myrmecia] bisecta TaxID=41462 RepID=A0AAW1P8G6_9CHLO